MADRQAGLIQVFSFLQLALMGGNCPLEVQHLGGAILVGQGSEDFFRPIQTLIRRGLATAFTVQLGQSRQAARLFRPLSTMLR